MNGAGTPTGRPCPEPQPFGYPGIWQVAALLTEIAQRGVAILRVEQKLTIALMISRRVYVMGRGRVVFEGTPQELRANDALRKEWREV